MELVKRIKRLTSFTFYEILFLVCYEYSTINKWKTFTLTHIDYPAEDAFGKGLAIISLLPLVIVVIFLTFFAIKRDLHTVCFGIGVILNGILNYCLKHTFKEPRPSTMTEFKPMGGTSSAGIRISFILQFPRLCPR